MNSWYRLAVVAGVTYGAIYLGTAVSNPKLGLLIGFLLNILASPFGQKLIEWVERGAAGAPPTPGKESASPRSPETGTDATTALIILATTTYALLLINVATTGLLEALDQLEKVKLLSFTELGYVEAQKYLAGCLLFVVWFPAITAVSLALSGSNRPLSFGAFAFGTALSLPLYYLLIRTLSLDTGLRDAAQTSLSLGGPAVNAPGYSGFGVTGLVYQLGMVVMVGLVFSMYAWCVANGSRWVLRLVGRVVSRLRAKKVGGALR